MPITLPPLTRRQFLVGSAVGMAGVAAFWRCEAAEPSRDPNRFALFADTHVAGDRATVVRGTNMADNFAQAAQEVSRCDPAPSAVLVCGDCAYLDGRTDDYRLLVELAAPLRQGGIPVHFALGNHDHRQRFWDIASEGSPPPSLVRERHVTVIDSPLARWYLLDSLDETNKTPGVLGKSQLDWLAGALDKQADRPALVMVHHNPDHRPEPSGLVETEQLLELLTARPQVKGLFFGHSHRWSIGRTQHVHLINLPPVAYPFQEGDPNGWVDAQLRPDGMMLTMHCIDATHALHGKQFDLAWR